MNVGAVNILAAAAVGLGATLLMDLWNLFLNRAFRIPSLNYCLLGRWLRHMAGGTFRHANITAAPPRRFECTVGSIAHYSIGVVFAVVFVRFVSGNWLVRPTLPPRAALRHRHPRVPVLRHAAVVRPRRGRVEDAQSDAGQAQGRHDAYRVRNRAVRLGPRCELRTAACLRRMSGLCPYGDSPAS